MTTGPGQPCHLPPLAGIDTAEGLQRVEQDHAFYLSILLKFRDRQGNFVERVRRLLSGAGDRGAAKREAHTLKGLAATIGAKELSAVAWELERGMDVGADVPECLRLLENVGSRLAVVLAAIGTIEPLRAPGPGAPPTLDGQGIATLIEEARRLLAAFNTEVEGAVQRLCGALAGTAQGERAQRVRELVGRYDYEAASMELEALAREV